MTFDKTQLHVIERVERGRFAKGAPGRPPGSKNKISRETLNSIQAMGPEAIRQLWLLVAAGDQKSVVYVLDRILPAAGRVVEMDDVSPSTVTQMLMDGQLSPLEAKAIAATLLSLREIEDLSMIKEKLIELESIVDGSAKR